jgi:BTB/POZ domain-containing protein 9
MLLWDRDQRSYSYYIEVSMDQKDWVKVVDHSRYHCRSWQFLFFQQRVARFIRIVGTHNTVNKVFHVVTMEALYTDTAFNLDNGLLIPKTNIATLAHSALVIEGVCRSRNALLNGETANYDWDSGYTCHQLGSGAIMVQLGQPYALDSMKLLLWDCDERSYSYYIEVSVNQRDWEVVCDRTREACRTWQSISFPRRAVVFIRIVGTHNTANEVFHCVHFECPASEEIPHSSPTSQTPSNENTDMDQDPCPTHLAPLLMEHHHAPQEEEPVGAPALPQHPRHQPSDLFQLPLAAAALPLGPPALPLGPPLQGLPQGAQGQNQGLPQGQGAVPRSARTVRRNNNNNQPSPP